MYYENLSGTLREPELWDWLHTTDAPEQQRAEEVSEMQETAAALALALPSAEPSGDVRESLLAHVSDEKKKVVPVNSGS